MPRYSIIIPTYNAAKTLVPLLDILAQQSFTDFETIVVDDNSEDDTKQIASRYSLLYLKQEERSGPAAARNKGAACAKGEWLIFTDADTLFSTDTMEIIDTAVSMCDGDAFVGTYTGQPANSGFMPRYKALWEQVCIDDVLMRKGENYIPYNTWAPRPGLVKKKVFDAVAGFDESFRGADLEDIEFGYRLVSHGYRIFFAPSIHIKHNYPATFYKELYSFARRCSIYMCLKRTHRGFDMAGEGAPVRILAHFFGFAAFGSGLLVPFHISFLAIFSLCMVVFMSLNGRFLLHAFYEESLSFSFKAFIVCWIHTVVMGFSAAHGLALCFLVRR
ncbi:MAG: glycosyltransferase family 2 protein [Candidatus Hydrogenedentes bacterium]|nr:glycosyltransferase family 2 protein [Candidatus Hydrogenedentota bacterium]